MKTETKRIFAVTFAVVSVAALAVTALAIAQLLNNQYKLTTFKLPAFITNISNRDAAIIAGIVGGAAIVLAIASVLLLRCKPKSTGSNGSVGTNPPPGGSGPGGADYGPLQAATEHLVAKASDAAGAVASLALATGDLVMQAAVAGRGAAVEFATQQGQVAVELIGEKALEGIEKIRELATQLGNQAIESAKTLQAAGTEVGAACVQSLMEAASQYGDTLKCKFFAFVREYLSQKSKAVESPESDKKAAEALMQHLNSEGWVVVSRSTDTASRPEDPSASDSRTETVPGSAGTVQPSEHDSLSAGASS